MTPKARVSIAAAALALTVFFVLPRGRAFLEDMAALARMPRDKHVAVLPLANTSGDPGDQAFCDGLLEVATAGLTRLAETRSRLVIVPVSDIREQRIATVSEARRSVGANLAFSGSVERRGDRVILTLDLVDTRTRRTLRSGRIDEAMSDAAIFQDGIIVEFAEMLGVRPRRRELDPIAAARTDSPEAYDAYLRARGHLQRFVKEDSVDAAIELLRQAIESDPLYASAHAAMGEACWRKCEATWDTVWVHRATESCEKALTLDDHLGHAHVTLGLIKVGRGLFGEAIDELKRALAQDPLSADAHRELARAYHGLGETETALATYERAIELRPSYWAGYNALGTFYYRQGELEAAAIQFRHVIRLAPENVIAYANLGAVYYAMGHLDDACAALEKSIAIKPNYRALNNLATIHYLEGQYRDAAAMYEMALLHDDRDYRVWGNLASSYRQLGMIELSDDRYDRAIEMAERFLTVNRRDPGTLTNLAGYYVTRGEWGRIIELLERALTIAPSDVEVLYRSIHIFEIIGERDRALELVPEALRRGLRGRIEGEKDLRELVNDERYQILIRQHP